ncbi:MAG: hypothetical protein RSC68_25300, partial [Acinetobacter sp.]
MDYKNKIMKQTMKFGLFIALVVLVASCTKDIKSDIDDPRRPVPTAIVLMPQEVVIQNGETLLLPFRVNPSTYQVTVENLRLDAVEHTITKSSYVTSLEEYTLESVEAR